MFLACAERWAGIGQARKRVLAGVGNVYRSVNKQVHGGHEQKRNHQ